MRLLVACPKCRRQFDASGRPIGSRFRCCCGAVVTIRQPLGHDAAVVRCSSCGAPREEGSAACRHCGSDFTLHEQDLDTVCPGCLARVSNRAKFCHYCGLALLPEPLTSQKTALNCPACGKGSRLSHRQIGDVAVSECGRCAGFWLAANVFAGLIDKASHDALGVDWGLQQATSRRGASLDPAEQRGSFYRQCPSCGKMMNRRNYARHSGVIIDACKEHGIWFDSDELPRVLAWARSGGLAEAERVDADDAARQERREHIKRLAALERRGTQVNDDEGLEFPIGDLALWVANWFL